MYREQENSLSIQAFLVTLMPSNILRSNVLNLVCFKQLLKVSLVL